MKYFLYSKIMDSFITLPDFLTTSDFSQAHSFDSLAEAAAQLHKAKKVHGQDYEIWDAESLAETIKL